MFAGFAVLYSTRWGPGVGYDSMFYLDAAVNISQGKGVYWIGSGGELKPLSHYPPVYPLVLALPLAFGASQELAVRIPAVVIAGYNSYLIGYIIYHFTRRIWFALLAECVLMLSPVILRLHLLAMSDPLFFLWLLLSLFLLVRYLNEDRPLLYYLASASLALASLNALCGLLCIGSRHAKGAPIEARVAQR